MDEVSALSHDQVVYRVQAGIEPDIVIRIGRIPIEGIFDCAALERVAAVATLLTILKEKRVFADSCG